MFGDLLFGLRGILLDQILHRLHILLNRSKEICFLLFELSEVGLVFSEQLMHQFCLFGRESGFQLAKFLLKILLLGLQDFLNLSYKHFIRSFHLQLSLLV